MKDKEALSLILHAVSATAAVVGVIILIAQVF
jgi:hypothetical protein